MELRRTVIITVLMALASTLFAQSAGVTNVTVTYSATPTFTANAGITNFDITLAGNVTSSTFSSPAVGVGSFKICQDPTGGRSFTWPVGAIGFGTIDTVANTCSRQTWKYTGSVLQATGPMITDGSAPGGIPGLGTAATQPSSAFQPAGNYETYTPVTALPTAATAVVGKLYRWNTASGPNVCPLSGAAGSGGTSVSFCVTMDGTSWLTVLFVDSTGRILLAPGTAFEVVGATQVTCTTPATGSQTLCFNSSGHLTRVSPDAVAHDLETTVNGLTDPGGNGLVKRTAPQTTAPATVNVDYIGATTGAELQKASSGGLAPAVPQSDFYKPGAGTILPGDLPLPSTTTLGGFKAYTCSGSDKVISLNADGSVNCGADIGPTPGLGRSSVTLTFPAILDGTCNQQTGTWTGITTADTVVFGAPSGLTLDYSGRVSASDTVAVRACNLTGATVTPGVSVFNLTLAVYNLSATATIDFGVIQDGTCATNNLTITGAAAGDPVTPKWPAALETGLYGSAITTATDIVQLRLCNLSGAAVDPASATFGASIAR